MPLQPLHNEHDLLAQVANDDHEAFRVIFNHYWEKIYSISLSYTSSIPQAEDLVQDIFLRVWDNRHKLDTVLQFDDWLFILARNTLVSAIRRNVQTVPIGTGKEDDLQSTDEEPYQIFALKESQTLIDRAVEQLPPQQRRVYELSRNRGLSQLEIARELGVSVSTVKSHLTKALGHIRATLAEQNNRSQFIWLIILTSILGK